MKKAYLSIGIHSRHLLNAEVEILRKTLAHFQVELFVFVDKYHFLPDQEKQMMQQAFADIESSHFLIAEVSQKAIGVGIEIGYAAASHKPVIFIRNASSEHSTTASGTATHTLIYQSLTDLENRLSALLSNMDI